MLEILMERISTHNKNLNRSVVSPHPQISYIPTSIKLCHSFYLPCSSYRSEWHVCSCLSCCTTNLSDDNAIFMLREYRRSKSWDDNYIRVFACLYSKLYRHISDCWRAMIPTIGLLLAVARTDRKQKTQIHITNKLKDLSGRWYSVQQCHN